MPNVTTATVLANVRAEMARRRVRQSDLAEALSVSTGVVSATLNGKQALTTDRLLTIAQVLQVSPAQLLESA